jgi:hypothetical protein
MGGSPKQPAAQPYTPPPAVASPTQIQQGIDPVTGLKIKKARKGGSSATVLTSSSGVAGQADTSKKTVLGG